MLKKFCCILCFSFALFGVVYLIDSYQKYERSKNTITVTCDFDVNYKDVEETDVSGLTEEEIHELLIGGK